MGVPDFIIQVLNPLSQEILPGWGAMKQCHVLEEDLGTTSFRGQFGVMFFRVGKHLSYEHFIP